MNKLFYYYTPLIYKDTTFYLFNDRLSIILLPNLLPPNLTTKLHPKGVKYKI